MTKLANNTRIEVYDDSVYVSQYAFYHAVYYNHFGGYFHYKTNIPVPSTNTMFMIEAVGYSYGSNLPIRCAWSGYTYPPVDDVIAIGLSDCYGGLSASGVYRSTDGYVVIRASGSSYFTGFEFNGYTTNPTGTGFNIQITAEVLSGDLESF